MKTFLIFLFLALFSLPAFAQTQGTSMRSTNGSAFGATTHFRATSNYFSGRANIGGILTTTNPIIYGTVNATGTLDVNGNVEASGSGKFNSLNIADNTIIDAAGSATFQDVSAGVFNGGNFIGAHIGNGAGLTNLPGGAANTIANTNGVGYGTTFYNQTNWPSIAAGSGGNYLKFQSSWTSNSTYAAPFNFWQSWGWQNTFDHPHPDVATSYGYNDGIGGVVNRNEPSLTQTFENRWQNLNGFEQSEYYITWQSPTNGYGTNTATRWFGYTPVWYVNAFASNQTYASSEVAMETESFVLRSTGAASSFYTTLGAAAGATVNVVGNINMYTNGNQASALTLRGGILTIGGPIGPAVGYMNMLVDWNNQSGVNKQALIYPSGYPMSLNIGSPGIASISFTNVNISTNLNVYGKLTTVGTLGMYGLIGSGNVTNAAGSRVSYVNDESLTNSASSLSPNFALDANGKTRYSLLQTNAAFAFLLPSGVNTTKTLHQTTVVYVTNSLPATGAPVTFPASIHASGVNFVTNLSVFTFTQYAQLFTNVVGLPLY